jgi:hypothetical protein
MSSDNKLKNNLDHPNLDNSIVVLGHKMFKCSNTHCGKIFPSKSKLKIHIRIHVNKCFLTRYIYIYLYLDKRKTLHL